MLTTVMLLAGISTSIRLGNELAGLAVVPRVIVDRLIGVGRVLEVKVFLVWLWLEVAAFRDPRPISNYKAGGFPRNVGARLIVVLAT